MVIYYTNRSTLSIISHVQMCTSLEIIDIKNGNHSAAITASLLLFEHVCVDLSDRAWLSLDVPFHPKRGRQGSGLFFKVSTPGSVNHFFMDLVLCTGAL